MITRSGSMMRSRILWSRYSGLAVEEELDRLGDLADRLVELELAGVPRFDVRHQPIDVRAHGDVPPRVRLPAEA